jgi:hypothetical protein
MQTHFRHDNFGPAGSQFREPHNGWAGSEHEKFCVLGQRFPPPFLAGHLDARLLVFYAFFDILPIVILQQ